MFDVSEIRSFSLINFLDDFWVLYVLCQKCLDIIAPFLTLITSPGSTLNTFASGVFFPGHQI